MPTDCTTQRREGDGMTEATLRVIVQDYTDGRIAFRTLANALTDAAMSFHYNRHLAPAGL